jgi:hypothetical protein
VLEERLVEQPPEAENLDLVPVREIVGQVERGTRRPAALSRGSART